jgi:hypothetical protein
VVIEMSIEDEKSAAAPPLLCPSAQCTAGARLLGIVLPNGAIAFAHNRIIVNQDFVEVAHRGRRPEKRFRFANRCLEFACQQWKHDRCGVADQLVDGLLPVGIATVLPSCGIRPQCRWFGQRGESACRICPEILTDAHEDLE